MVAPSVLPGRAFQRVDRVSRCLVHWRAADLTINPLTGQVASFARASLAGSSQDQLGGLRKTVHSQPRFGFLDEDADGIYESPHLLLERSRTQLPENADLETDSTGYVASAATLARDATGTRAPSGLASLKVTTTNAIGSGVFIRKRDGTRMAAAATTIYTGGVWIYLPAGHPAIGKTLKLQYDWYNSTPALISSSTSTARTLVAGINRISFNAGSPAATVTVDMLVATDVAEGVFDFWVDLPSFETGEWPSTAMPTNTDVGGLTRADEDFAIPTLFNPPAIGQEMTFYIEFSPLWPRTGTLLVAPGLFAQGGAGSYGTDGKCVLDLLRETASGTLISRLNVNEAGSTQTGSIAVPTTGRIKALVQLRASGESHLVHLEVNGVTGADSATRLMAGTSWRANELRVGVRANAGAERGDFMVNVVKAAYGRYTADQIAQLF
jgi:hypothetical protein